MQSCATVSIPVLFTFMLNVTGINSYMVEDESVCIADKMYLCLLYCHEFTKM